MRKNGLFAALLLGLLALSGCGGIVPGPQTTALAAEGPAAAGEPEPAPPAYDVYAPFGMQYDGAEDALYFGGERVRYFFDGVDTGDGGRIARAEHIDEAGTVDVHTLRKTVDNGDGSVNPFGPLTGLEADSQAVFDARDIEALLHPALEATTGCSQCSGGQGVSFAERFEPYRDYGVEFVELPEGSGTGNVYLDGALADAFADVSKDGTFVFHSADRGTFSIRAVRDGEGNLTGVERFTGELRL